MNLDTLENVLLALLVADAIALAVLVLIQQGKGADAGAAFGAGGAGTVFGSAGSTSFLVKMTSWLAIGFFAIAFGLAYTAKESRTWVFHRLQHPCLVLKTLLSRNPVPATLPMPHLMRWSSWTSSFPRLMARMVSFPQKLTRQY